MSLLHAVGALVFVVAALLGAFALASHRASYEVVARVLAALGGATLLSALGHPASQPLAVFGAAAALLPRPVSYLLASAAALLLCLRPPDVSKASSAALVLAALAAAAAAAAVSSSSLARIAAGLDAGWVAIAGGAGLTLVLAAMDGGRVLRWEYALGSGSARLDLPGAAVLLGLTLLASLGGTLMLGAHLLTVSPAAADRMSSLARVAGQRLLFLAAGLSVLGAGLVLARGFGLREDALAAGASEVAALALAVGLLVLGLLLLLGEPVSADAIALEARAAVETRAAVVLGALALATAGFEGWLRRGTYAVPTVAGAMSAALLGLAALQATRLGTLRRVALLVGLLSLLV